MGMHRNGTFFDQVSIDIPQFVPVNEHSELLGIGGSIIRLTLLELTPKGRIIFINAFHRQRLPPHWLPLVSPRVSTAKDQKLMMGAEEIKHWFQIAPFALRGEILKLPPSNSSNDNKLEREPRVIYTANALMKYRARGNTKQLYNAWLAFSLTLPLIFARTRKAGNPVENTNSLDELYSALMNSRRAAQINWPGSFNTPNVNTGRHYRQCTDDQGHHGRTYHIHIPHST
jgi:hypothetical protein